MSTPASVSGSPAASPRGSAGPFPRPGGRKALVEKSPLIRHPSTLSTGSLPVWSGDDGDSGNNNVISCENHQFLKDVVEQVVAGDGVGWLKLNRLKKLMEDENYRVIILNKFLSSLEPKVSPDDHIQDVVSRYLIEFNIHLIINFLQCIAKPVYKGILKVLLTVVSGLELSISNAGLGGLSSAFRLLELAHTHFWTKDLLDNVQHGLNPSTVMTSGNSSDVSQYSSRENLDQDQQHDSLSSVSSVHYPGLATREPNSLHPSLDNIRVDHDSSQLLRDLILKKKQLLFGRMASADSEGEDSMSVAASDTGSLTTNPVFQRGGRGFSSIRSALSDNEMDSVS